jgi:hypothetical protein
MTPDMSFLLLMAIPLLASPVIYLLGRLGMLGRLILWD